MPKPSTGIAGFDDIRFWAALLCYGVSLPLFFEGNVSWASFHVVMPSVIAFIIVTTLAWDFRIIGNPNNLFDLILHAAFMLSLVFLLNRLMSIEDFSPIIDSLPNFGGIIMDAVKRTPFFGEFFRIFDFVLKWLGFAVVLFLISGAIIFPPRIATVLMLLSGLFFIAISVGQNLNPSLWTLAAGLLAMVIAFRLQMEDERKSRFWSKVAEKFRRSPPRPALDMKLKIALLQLMHEEKAVGEKQIRGLVASKLNTRSDDPRLAPICIRIADQLSSQDGLAESRDGSQGWRFVLTIPEVPPDFYTTTARVVRIIVTLSFTILYILSPIDLIPDATPVFGVVDDMLLGSATLLATVKTLYPTSPLTPHPHLPFGTG